MKIRITEFAYLVLGVVLYSVAILTTFGRILWQHSALGPTLGPLVMIAFASLGGLSVIVLGYGMVIILGGSTSFGFIKFVARLMRSKQIVQPSTRPEVRGKRDALARQLHWLYVPGVVFICALGLGWDIHNADGPRAGSLQLPLHLLDVFTRPSSGIGPILFSRQLIPALVIITALAGIIPSFVLPYFEEFKVTGVNAGPFHTSLLLYAVGALAGLGVILTLVGLVYRSLWLNRAPLPYHFGILAILGFSLHFSLGMHLGMDRAERKILDGIRKSGNLKILS